MEEEKTTGCGALRPWEAGLCGWDWKELWFQQVQATLAEDEGLGDSDVKQQSFIWCVHCMGMVLMLCVCCHASLR